MNGQILQELNQSRLAEMQTRAAEVQRARQAAFSSGGRRFALPRLGRPRRGVRPAGTAADLA